METPVKSKADEEMTSWWRGNGRSRVLFSIGVLLLLLGTAVQGVFAGMGLEVVLLNAGPPQNVADGFGTIRPNPEWNKYQGSIEPVFVTGSVILAIAGLVVGFFASKQKTFPSWYLFITGVIPGALLLGGWKVIWAADLRQSRAKS